jgi:hypothetical protein
MPTPSLRAPGEMGHFTENCGIIYLYRSDKLGLGLGDAVQEPEMTAARPKDYLPLLGIVAAAVLGVSLLCGAAVVGIGDINNAVTIGTPSAGLVDFVISNMNTMIVETVQGFSQPDPGTNTVTLVPTNTVVLFNTSARFPLATLIQPTRTARPRPPATATYTPIPVPTKTPPPPPPTKTQTPLPPTLTPTEPTPTEPTPTEPTPTEPTPTDVSYP